MAVCKDTEIPLQYLNEFEFINYNFDGSLPWTTQETFLSKEYVAYTNLLGIDCEMVRVGIFRTSALGRVSIVNEHGFCVYDTFVNPVQEVADYLTEYSGIRPENLINAPKIDAVSKVVASIVSGRVLVGHAIHNDLEVLQLNHPIADIRDTANFFQHRNGSKRIPALRTLIKKYFNINIQDGEHCSIQDAQAALKLYLLFREEWEQDALERRRKANLIDTIANVTDITCMHIQPRQPDVLTESNSVFLRPNKLIGAYYSSEEYKDVQFRLLMEDVLRPLRSDLQYAKQRRHLNNQYKNIRIKSGGENTNFEVKDKRTLYVPIQQNGLEEVDWDDRNIFLSGSLLILSPDNFQSMKFAKVLDVWVKQTNDHVTLRLHVSFLLDGPSWTVTQNDRFQMIESKAFFQPYELILNFLQDVDLDSFPLKKYIVDAETKSEVVSHLRNHSTEKIDFSILMNEAKCTTNARAYPTDFGNWPSASELNLDMSQYEALQKAITQELTIVQGPPGTGKTHVSLQIVKLLLANNWLSTSPILIVSYSNHSLDELLEPILQFMTDDMHRGNRTKAEQSLLRIGGGCESEIIRPCTLQFKMKKLKKKRNNKNVVKSLGKALHKVRDLDFTNRFINRGIFNLKLAPQVMLARLETNERSQSIFKLWTKSHKEIEKNVLSWFGLNDEPIVLRGQSMTSISDRMFLLLSDNLELILKRKFPKIPITLEELQEKSLYNDNVEHQYLIRWGCYFFLIDQLAGIVNFNKMEYIAANNYIETLEQYLTKNQTLKQARVVGMTTTGAVKYKNQFVESKFKPKIMIVEEAAHVLEAHVVASLTRHCTQMILVGDHKQLRPLLADSDLWKNHLDVSLMERLVNNGIAQGIQNWTQLKVQHRMRSEIAKLISPVIYDELENHEDVEKYPDVKGCAKNLFFVHHTNPESKETLTKSRFNVFEANYIVDLLYYFTEYGYLPSQITVICAYLAQKTLIKNTIKSDPCINKILISTVDGFEGKQNDLIILSLVRNNDRNEVGFLKSDNRVCVALSRARHGLIMIGNMALLANSSDTWLQINRILTDNNSIGTELPLNRPLILKANVDPAFKTRPTPIVRYKRGNKRRVRGKERRKRRAEGRQIMENTVLQSVHISGSLHGKSTATSIITKLGCGHDAYVSCGLDPSRVQCNSKIKKTLPSSHTRHCLCPCWNSNVSCSCVITKKLACGHYTSALQSSKIKCNSPITVKLRCGHLRHCLCHEIGKPAECNVVVVKMHKCGHRMQVPCHKLSSASCVAEVTKKLSCGHATQVNCSEKNYDMRCPVVRKCTYPCGHIHNFRCSKRIAADKCNTKVERILPCGHVQDIACHQSQLPIKCRHVVSICGNTELLS